MNYAFLLNGLIDQIGTLPGSFRNLSGIAALTTAEMANLAWAGHPDAGFIPHIDETGIQPQYNSRTQAITGPTTVVEGGMAISRFGIRAKTDDELTEQTSQDWIALRIERNQRLSRYVDAVNPIRWESLNDTQKSAWRLYRQKLLDLPQVTKDPTRPAWPRPPLD